MRDVGHSSELLYGAFFVALLLYSTVGFMLHHPHITPLYNSYYAFKIQDE
jgi:hypothetical protein